MPNLSRQPTEKDPIIARLKPTDVPTSIKKWQEFALTFDGYVFHGSFDKCAAIANRRKPKTLTEFRTCLFFEQRRWRHFGTEPEGDDLKYIRFLLDGIRKMVGESTARRLRKKA